MSIPSTGNTFQNAGFGQVDNRFYDRGPLAAVLFRDYQGSSTNISPFIAGSPSPVVNWSPFALDGQLRTDLFADVLIDGEWYKNTDANEGWWRAGAFDEKGGPDRKPAIKHDDQMILQSNFPFDTDMTGEGITIQFNAIEKYRPALQRLRMNLPLMDPTGTYSIVEDVGQPNYVLSKPVDYDSPNRQILCVFARQRGDSYVYSVEGYPLVKLTDIGAEKRSKTDPDAGPLTFTALPDPFFTDIDPTDPDSGQLVNAFYSTWVGGGAWASMYEHGS